MATWEEVAKHHADDFRQAVRSSGFTKAASASSRNVPQAPVFEAVKRIARGIENLTVAGKPATEKQKEEMAREVGRELGLENPDDFFRLTKSASIDAHTDMVTSTVEIVNEILAN